MQRCSHSLQFNNADAKLLTVFGRDVCCICPLMVSVKLVSLGAITAW